MSAPLSRRTVLRGAGAVVALPFLDAMLPGRSLFTRTAAAAVRATMQASAPARMVFVFLPNGVAQDAWGGATMAPLAAHVGRYSVIKGLCHRNAEAQADGPGDHARSGACFLTGAHPRKTSGGDIEAGISVDQVAAAQLAGTTRMESLELGGEPGMTAGNCDSGYSCAYSANISWRSPHTPSGKEHDPRRVFDRLFGTGPAGESPQEQRTRMGLRRSILDAVRQRAVALDAKLGMADRRKMEEYLESIRSVERRLDFVQKMAAPEGPAASAQGAGAHRSAPHAPPAAPPAEPGDYTQRIRLLADMATLALQMDQTRIVTLMLANEGSNRAYPEVGVTDGHHDVSHHGNEAAKLEKFAAINRWQTQQLAHFLDTLAAAQDQGAPLLDRTMLVYGGAIADGNRHNHDDLPVLLAGGAALGIRHEALRTAPAGTPMCNLYQAMLQRMGVNRPRFGDSTGVLAL